MPTSPENAGQPKIAPARRNIVAALSRRGKRVRGGGAWPWIAALAAAAAWLVFGRDPEAERALLAPRVVSNHEGSWNVGRNDADADRYAMLLRPPPAPEQDAQALADAKKTPPPADGFVRVAAVQTESRLGNVPANRAWLTRHIRLAAAAGARIVAMPEAAVCGLADLERGLYWTRQARGEARHWPVERVAEPADGPSARYFGELCRELGLYLAMTFIEAEAGRYYSAALLLDPQGKAVLKTRKLVLADDEFEVDADWASPGQAPEAADADLGEDTGVGAAAEAGLDTGLVARTPYGRVGILIRLDAFRGASRAALHAAGADIILNPTSLVMEQPGSLLDSPDFWRRMGATPARTSWVVANWAAPDWAGWEGHGFSRVRGWRGQRYAAPGDDGAYGGECVVLGDVPMGDGQ